MNRGSYECPMTKKRDIVPGSMPSGRIVLEAAARDPEEHQHITSLSDDLRSAGAMRAVVGFASARIDHFLAKVRPPTPCIVLDLDTVRTQYRALQACFPSVDIYYAVKANPAVEVLSALAALGGHFDLASAGEIDRCRALKIPATRFSLGNTIKHERAIARAYAAGVDLFAFDSAAELEKLVRCAPGARAFCRILVKNTGAEWPLTRKFGCESRMAVDLLLGRVPAAGGLSTGTIPFRGIIRGHGEGSHRRGFHRKKQRTNDGRIYAPGRLGWHPAPSALTRGRGTCGNLRGYRQWSWAFSCPALCSRRVRQAWRSR
jgi:hypothetical protein